MEQEPHYPNDAELKNDHADGLQQEPIRPDQVRSPGWTHRGGMGPQQESALEYNKRANEHLRSLHGRKEEQRPDVENAPAPENKPANELPVDHKPEETPDQSRTGEASPDRAEEKKKANEQKFDAKRFMNDPDYRREMKEQRHAAQSERVDSREQEAEREVVTERQR